MRNKIIPFVVVIILGILWFVPIIPYSRTMPVQCVTTPCNPIVEKGMRTLKDVVFGMYPTPEPKPMQYQNTI